MSSLQWRPGKRVAIVGGGPGGVSAGIALRQRGFDVRIYEKQPVCKASGGGVVLSVPVLAVLRSYGVSLENFAAPVVAYFKNKQGLTRAKLPFNEKVNKQMGIAGWQYGILRSDAFQKLLDLVPDGVIHTDHEFLRYTEMNDGVTVEFKNGDAITADIVVGADGIRSGVSAQAFGPPPLFHTGIRVWLAWCDHIPDIPPDYGYISHDRQFQASFFPMLHDGKPGFEWWVVEPSWEGKPVPRDTRAHLAEILKDWNDPMPRLLAATNLETQAFRWEVYNRPSMKKWSKGQIVCVGDAVHPVSPYAAYGMGMAIEDGYFLAKFLDSVDLCDHGAVSAAFEMFEERRVEYVNHNMEFARFTGNLWHSLPWPLSWIRDQLFDKTPLLQNVMARGYLEAAEKESLAMKELHVV